jgi:hypothetical protein
MPEALVRDGYLLGGCSDILGMEMKILRENAKRTSAPKHPEAIFPVAQM